MLMDTGYMTKMVVAWYGSIASDNIKSKNVRISYNGKIVGGLKIKRETWITTDIFVFSPDRENGTMQSNFRIKIIKRNSIVLGYMNGSIY